MNPRRIGEFTVIVVDEADSHTLRPGITASFLSNQHSN